MGASAEIAMTMPEDDHHTWIVSVMSEAEQLRLMKEKHAKCWTKMFLSQNKTKDPDRKTCEVTWDNVLCWDETPAGTLARQPCPDYVNGLNKHEYASKLCTVNGTWYFNTELNKTWTNYSDCLKPPADLSFHNETGERLRLIYTVGYSFSLFSLIIAIIIMLCSRRLHSKSNTLHINLFIAFILRASISFLKDLLFVRNLALEKDVAYRKDGTLKFLHNGTHWECKMLFSMFNYTILASSMWILMEGLYLHNLIYRTLRTERNGVRYYIIAGWLLPLVFLIPWITVKATLENLYCWNLPAHTPYHWFLKAPVIAIVVTNFLFFLDIFRVLFLRARMNRRHIGNAKYRKLAKFILVLIPLFGVMYIFLYVAFPSGFNPQDFNPIYMYIEMTYNSFQGFILAVLFCFLNEEVHTELRRMYQRHKSRRGDSMALTRSFAVQSGRRGSNTRVQGFRSRSGNKMFRQGSTSSQDFRPEPSDELRRKVLATTAHFQMQPRPGSVSSGDKSGDMGGKSGKELQGGRGILLKILRKRRRKTKNRHSNGGAATDDGDSGCKANGKLSGEHGKDEVVEELGLVQATAADTTTKAQLEHTHPQKEETAFQQFPHMDSIDSNDDVVVWGMDSSSQALTHADKEHADKEHAKSVANETDRNDNEKLLSEEEKLQAEKPKKVGKTNLTVRFSHHEDLQQGSGEGESKRRAPRLKYIERQPTVDSEDSLEYVDLSSDELTGTLSPVNGSAPVFKSSN